MAPQPEMIERAAGILRAGGVVCFPTRCLYGLGVDALNPAAVDRVFEAKGRPADKPLSVFISRPEQVALLAKRVPPAAAILMKRFWPGRLTIILEARGGLPENLNARRGTIGVRLPGHPVAVALTQAAGGPITATSANLSGEAGANRVGQVSRQLLARVDLILDAGPLKGGVGSTIVDVTVDPPVVLREGEITKVDIAAAIKSP
jgi:L-threonylcarbamoyladenylate synthase